MEGFQLHRLLINPRTTLLHGDRIIQLGIEGEHMQLHGLAIHLFHVVHHVLNELGI